MQLKKLIGRIKIQTYITLFTRLATSSRFALYLAFKRPSICSEALGS